MTRHGEPQPDPYEQCEHCGGEFDGGHYWDSDAHRIVCIARERALGNMTTKYAGSGAG